MSDIAATAVIDTLIEELRLFREVACYCPNCIKTCEKIEREYIHRIAAIEMQQIAGGAEGL